jgi:hypothetical protein
MKNFLRILAIIFFVVIIIIILRSGMLKDENLEISQETVEETTDEVGEENPETSAQVSETEESIQEIIDPAPQEEGVVILGGDGIPNN